MKTTQCLCFTLACVGVLALSAVSLYYNAKKDETIAMLSGRLLDMESRVTRLETLPSRVLALETLPARVDMVEALAPRVGALESLPDRVSALETLPPRLLAAEKQAERIATLETHARTQSEQLDKLTSVSPAFAPHADVRLRRVANRLVQYGILSADNSFLDNFARLENGDLGIKDYPFVLEMLRSGSQEKAVPASCVRAFLDAGADPLAVDEEGETTLMAAVSQQDPEVVRLLIAAGVDVNAADSSGYTALMIAVEDGSSLGIVKDLLAAGANPEAKNADGATAIDLCSNEEMARLLKSPAADSQ